jgi:hypothetical protein
LLSASVAGCSGDDPSPGPTDGETNVQVKRAFGYGGVALETSAKSMAVATQDAESEPNDTRGTATPVQKGVDVTGQLEAAEVDWFAFEASSDATITTQFTKESSTGVVSVAVYDTNGEFIDEIYVSSDATATREFTATTSGTYFVQIVDVEAGDGSYVLRVDSSASSDTTTETMTPTATATETETPTPTATTTATGSDYGTQSYGEYGYGGTA